MGTKITTADAKPEFMARLVLSVDEKERLAIAKAISGNPEAEMASETVVESWATAVLLNAIDALMAKEK